MKNRVLLRRDFTRKAVLSAAGAEYARPQQVRRGTDGFPAYAPVKGKMLVAMQSGDRSRILGNGWHPGAAHPYTRSLRPAAGPFRGIAIATRTQTGT
jgi:hypothetical protein